MIKLAVSGCCGRMGGRIIALASQDKSFNITGALEVAAHPNIGKNIGGFLGISSISCKITDNVNTALKDSHVLIEFSAPDATIYNVAAAKKLKKAVIVGTTGLSEAQHSLLRDAAKSIPIVYSPNMSVGVNTLFSVLPEIAKRLGTDYSVEIVEAHHHAKKDAPSGTAKKLAEVIKSVTKKDIPSHSIRLGDIVGDHTVIFCGNSERIEIKHQAHSRDLFVLGALKSAKWITGKPAGLYSMQDVLKISN